MDEKNQMPVPQDTAAKDRLRGYEAPKLRKHGKWNRVTTQVISIPIDP
ncbi:hypothetical protein [Deinococcus cellulosilyticus]|uniref:Uncharacterized protein n=1 Tax=Deinococcus cellulosilyticus (strain DSM 18568 / NBRC 106333 / KACC 11606 / 5516J-15) TaxID=1223518 RepID=A0A511N1Y4_DEIC1|nr:hypothetical protein [Deinococcus cellulosilyticus]GEM46860.1 hypothetical protein DC3_24950 [Deinococcus cellulosilyticus NBRC 106333 = KACC 11606]